jgi:hypothetical protein
VDYRIVTIFRVIPLCRSRNARDGHLSRADCIITIKNPDITIKNPDQATKTSIHQAQHPQKPPNRPP